jgi:hypothetical protein
MKSLILFVILCAGAAGLPWLPRGATPDINASSSDFPGWPRQWEGEPLEPLPLSSREERFAAGFPGRIARFRAGPRQLIMRWVARETRMLHPAEDCFRGSGFTVDPLGIRTGNDGASWGCFRAANGAENLSVCERIFDQSRNSWTDVSSWYWAATLGESSGPWWAVTIADGSK